MWLMERQLQNLWATRKLEMQVEIGGMDRKINETTWKFFMHLCEFKAGMNTFAISARLAQKSDNLNVESRARECFLCLPYDHSYRLHF